MKKLNFITNLDVNKTSGGWGGINYNIYNQLNQSFDVNYIGPINPPHIQYQNIYNKILRTVGFRSNFSFFSNKRLALINSVLKKRIRPADYNFFFGQTSWIDYDSRIPYGVYLDADFKTYVDIFSTPRKFLKQDIQRIQKREELWLQNARDIFVGSEWAWGEMVKHYNLKESQKNVVFTGGNIELPEADGYITGYNFIFISLNFEKKGGFVCVEAFQKIKNIEPTATLTIIGQRPPDSIMSIDGIVYAGFLKKSDINDMSKFKKILSEAFILIHPTTMDTMGAVLVEAGYFGCPSIAPKSFGVPELVLNNKTGIIVDVPFTVDSFVDNIIDLINDKSKYLRMRENAWEYTRSQLTWGSVGTIMCDIIKTN